MRRTWKSAMDMPTTPATEPTERSMFRETMMSTMPVAMTATADVWTDRFQRLRELRNRPPEARSKPIQMTARAMIMPSSRVSISRVRSNPVTPRRLVVAGLLAAAAGSLIVGDSWLEPDVSAPRAAAGPRHGAQGSRQ